MKPTIYNAIKPFAERAGHMRMLDYLLQEILPKSLSGQIYVLNVRDGVLVLGVPNAAIATQVRFQASQWVTLLNTKALQVPGLLPGLSSGISHGLPTVLSLESRVVSKPIKTQTPKTERELGDSTRALLMDMAAHEGDEPLARVLRKLAKVGARTPR